MDQLEWGACHGDFHGGNAHHTPSGQVTFFDFDCGGLGWRSYELAVFRWAIALNRQVEKLWEAYLTGYTQHRAIHPPDLAAVPVFVALRQIWLLGLQCGIAATYGTGFLTQLSFEKQVGFLKRWVTQHLDETQQEDIP